MLSAASKFSWKFVAHCSELLLFILPFASYPNYYSVGESTSLKFLQTLAASFKMFLMLLYQLLACFCLDTNHNSFKDNLKFEFTYIASN